jgi:hypothetical protein
MVAEWTDRRTVWLVWSSALKTKYTFLSFDGGLCKCLALQFFDDDELVLLLNTTEGMEHQAYLTTTLYRNLEMRRLPPGLGESWNMQDLVGIAPRNEVSIII